MGFDIDAQLFIFSLSPNKCKYILTEIWSQHGVGDNCIYFAIAH